MGKYVGIDLGTTFSAVAYVDENGNPQVIRNSEGDNITPSVVLFEDGNPVVGGQAKKEGRFCPGCYADFIKRHMGEKSFIFRDESGGNTYKPEEISSIILKQLKIDAENALGDNIDGAVITVPAYFTDLQRQATKDAAKIAGISVLALINEPTAAAIAFGVTKNILSKQIIMIYDFGGGTFDVSILEIDKGNIKVLSTSGNSTLGGYDIDKAIYDYVVSKASDEGVDIEADLEAKQLLMMESEEVKKSLSRKNKATVTTYVGGKKYSQVIEKEVFEEEIIDNIIERTISIMEGAINEANLEYEQVDKILLVGGSTRIPLVRERIKEETGIEPSQEIHPDEAVCIGAAIHAVDVAKKDKKAENLPPVKGGYDLEDVTSHGIGVVVYDNERKENYNSIIIEKNTPIPVEKAQDYLIPANSSGVEVQITSGEFEELDYTVIIGAAVLETIPKDYDVPVRIVISCDSNSIIHATAIDLEENMNLGEINIDRSEHNMTEEEVSTAKIRINSLNIGK
jgi:hypothetical protein